MAGAVCVGVAEVELVEEGLPCMEAELVVDCEVIVEELEDGLDPLVTVLLEADDDPPDVPFLM